MILVTTSSKVFSTSDIFQINKIVAGNYEQLKSLYIPLLADDSRLLVQSNETVRDFLLKWVFQFVLSDSTRCFNPSYLPPTQSAAFWSASAIAEKLPQNPQTAERYGRGEHSSIHELLVFISFAESLIKFLQFQNWKAFLCYFWSEKMEIVWGQKLLFFNYKTLLDKLCGW